MVGKVKVSTPNSYKTYLAISDHPVSLSIYVNIVNQFFKFLMNLIMEGHHIKLPFRCGSVYVKGTKMKVKLINGEITGASPDWVKTMKLWKKDSIAKASKKMIYHLNEHTNNIRYKILWSKKGINIENHSLYSLIFSRTNKRDVHQRIVEGKEYIITKH